MAGQKNSGAGPDKAVGTRRRFLKGVAGGVGLGVAPVVLTGCGIDGSKATAAAQDLPGYYPPTLTGMRGSHPGTVEVGHALRDGVPLPVPHSNGEVYDLVVVGGGISGLSAAYLYRERNPGARVLVLENHDDFGGHAKRNEFWIDGQLHLMNGGTYSIESPRPYGPVADGLLRRLGIDAAVLEQKILKRDFFPSLGLGSGVFLDRETFGADHMLRYDAATPLSKGLAASPLSARAQAQIAMLEDAPRDYLPGLTPEAKKTRLVMMSYRDYLRDVVGVEPSVIAFYQQRTHGLFGIGIEAVSALEAWATGLPGFAALGLPPGGEPAMGPTANGFADTGGSIDVHLPDGGATVARALVRALVPEALPGVGIETLVTQRADYAALDRGGAPTRIRLNATVVKVQNLPAGTEGVRVDYLRDGRAHTVLARHTVLACWNAVIPHLCPELPEVQKTALHEAVKTPLIYASVALRHWQSFVRLGVSQIHAPGGYFCDVNLNEPLQVGEYATAHSPDRPTLVRLTRTPCAPGLAEHDQNRAGRAEILATSLATYEREIRAQLDRMLGPGGFESGRDILAITVNRWPHGYAPEFNPLWEPVVSEAESPHVRGRARKGAITIANADAAAYAYMDAAIEQADRAVTELLGA
jgi:spermidine dehydrogenase